MIIEDIRTQDKMQRDLEIRLGSQIIEAIAGGLNGDRVLEAVKNILKSEEICKQSRDAFARTY